MGESAILLDFGDLLVFVIGTFVAQVLCMDLVVVFLEWCIAEGSVIYW